ncbi:MULTISPECIES: hypothetical protein [Flavobacterium]|uniref:Uncharacterized protein n=1 Tax=Flavobacterium lacisediminis TaxID=2989705 RepID=A0ABT3EL66_9FLAO|nr:MULTISPECIES: hypothetical protein [Flavobacterium]MCW1149169.1 hypothetical protein [Flavobacterium lacisediminis]
MSKLNANSGTSRGISSKPSSTSTSKPNPNYPSKTGKPSGPGRGNTPKK